MAQRFTLDRKSFEQFLAAASLLQQFQKQATRGGRRDGVAQPLLELVETQRAIDSGGMNIDSAIERIVRLTLRVVGGEGTAVWLFSNDEFVFRAGSGRNASQDERLRLTVLARVAAICEPSRESFPGQREWAKGAGDSGYYPGAVRSLIIGPIYQKQTVMGALAAFSSDFDAFDQRDAGNIRLLSGLVGNAMERSLAAAQTRTIVALPRQQLLRLIEQIVPTVQKLVQQEHMRETPAQVADSSVQQGRTLETPSEQSLAEQPLVAESVAEVTSHLEPAIDPQPAITNLGVVPDHVLEQSPVDQEPVAPAWNTAALTDELARLSRNIVEIEGSKQLASLNEDMAASSDEPAADEAVSIEAANRQEPVGTDASLVLTENTETLDESPTPEPPFSIDDTAVPGIGVRAALYDDADETSQFWPAVRQGFSNTTQSFSKVFATMLHGLNKMGSSIATAGWSLGQQVRRASAYRPELPTLPTKKVTAVYRTAQSSLTEAASRAQTRIVNLAKHRPQFPRIPTAGFRQRVSNAGESLKKAAGAALAGINSFVNSLPDLPGFPTASAKRRLQEAQISATQSFKETSVRADKIQNYRLRIRLNGRALQRSASAFAVLVVMSTFLVMESGLFRSENTAAASAHESAARNASGPEQTVADKTPAPHSSPANAKGQRAIAAPSTPSLAGPTSHRTITDQATEDVVQNLTRYEVSSLRRQAESGDEEAAFQLGMAYELGYDMSQNCAKAAEWVTRAAEAGYPAAQYNLGLRYRDADGVQANLSESEKWLSRAAARKYRPARAALAALTRQEKPTAR